MDLGISVKGVGAPRRERRSINTVIKMAKWNRAHRKNDHQTAAEQAKVKGKSKAQKIKSAMEATFAPLRLTASNTKKIQYTKVKTPSNTRGTMTAIWDSAKPAAMIKARADVKPVDQKRFVASNILDSVSKIHRNRLMPFQAKSRQTVKCRLLL